MICLICRQDELIDELTVVIFERDEIRLKVDSVPARICPNCGDAVIDEDVAVRLLDAAEGVAEMGRSEYVLEYEKILN